MATIEEQMERAHHFADTSSVIGRGFRPSPGVKEIELNDPDLTTEPGTKVDLSKETQSPFMRFLRTILRSR